MEVSIPYVVECVKLERLYPRHPAKHPDSHADSVATITLHRPGIETLDLSVAPSEPDGYAVETANLFAITVRYRRPDGLVDLHGFTPGRKVTLILRTED